MTDLLGSTHLHPELALGLALLGTFVFFSLWLWIISLPGGRGLWRWGRSHFPLLSLVGSLLGPLLVLIGWLPRLAHSLQNALGLAGAGIGLMVAASFIWLFWSWQSIIKRRWEPFARPRLVDPTRGILVADRQTWRIVVASDPHFSAASSDPGSAVSFLRWARKISADAMFILGDFVEDGLSGWKLAADLLVQGLGSVPLLPVLGAHDALLGGSKLFLRVFPRDSIGPNSPWYFWFDLKDSEGSFVRFFVLHLLWGATTFDHRQQLWLTKALAETPPGVKKVALSHCFFVASGASDHHSPRPFFDHPETLARVAPLLEQGGVSLVISGHRHSLEELERNGIRYVVAGALGAAPARLASSSSPCSIWKCFGTHGGLEIEGHGTNMTLIFRDAQGKELHRSVV